MMFVMTEQINGKTPSDDITLGNSLSTRHTCTPFVFQGAKSSLQMPFAPCRAYLSLPSTSEGNLALTQEGFVRFNSLRIAQCFRNLIWEIQSISVQSHSLIPLDISGSYCNNNFKNRFWQRIKKIKSIPTLKARTGIRQGCLM